MKVGIIGCGQVSRVGHGLAIRADKRAVIAASADPDDENLKSFVRKFKVPGIYSDHKEMFKKETLDAVVIASPPWLHREHLKDSIDAGLHVLCEKPLATTPKDIKAMVRMAKEHDKIVQIGHSKRFEPGFQRIKETGQYRDFWQDLPDEHLLALLPPRFQGGVDKASAGYFKKSRD